LGKSTFLRYYYDCYRSTHIARTESESNRLLILYSDVRHSTDVRNLEENIYGAIASQVRIRFPEISIENDYGMWGPRAMWSDPAHAVASKHYKSLTQYRADVVKNFLTDVRIFAECALWYLTVGPGRQLHSTDVSLVLDNVDQLDRALQVMVLRIVLRWAGAVHRGTAGQLGGEPTPPNHDVNPLPDLRRIVVVVRPETLRTLRYAIHPLPAHRTFHLGRLDEGAVVAARGDSLTAAVVGTGRHIERDVDREDDSTTMYEVLPPRLAAARIRQLLDYNGVALLNDNTVQSGGQYQARRTLTQLVDGSVRRMLDIKSRLLRSRHLENSVLRIGESRSPRQSNYALIHALLTGGKRLYDSDDHDNPILNLYHTTRLCEGAHATLVGPHVMHVLRTQTYSRADLIKLLAEVGYLQTELEDCLARMFEKQFFTLSQDIDGQQSMEVLTGIVEAHIDLYTHPAYIDEMAIVTPVESSHLQFMCVTTPYTPSDFPARVRTSLQFLSQLKYDQEQFCQWVDDGSRYACDFTTFDARLRALRFPDVFKRAAVRYRQRLEGLTKERPALRRRISDRTWEELIRDPLLRCNDSDAKAILTATRT
jgi:hypothetical protein